MYGLDHEQAARQIARGIADFELQEFVDHLTETYSHGMRQRLAFAAALLHEPAVLVIDEPMVGLDPRSARLVKDLLQTKVREGMTIFMSTHLLTVAEEIAARVAIVDQGRLRFLGTVAQLQQELSLQNSSLEQLYLSLTATPGQIRDFTVPANPPAHSAPLNPDGESSAR
jgi:ABC-2 type transport system ATP-binding protein